MYKKFLTTAFVLGGLAVALGAFGAHKLKTVFSEDILQVYETAVKYQFYHVFALLFTGLLLKSNSIKAWVIAGWLFVVGISLFSGSLYVLCYLKSQQLTQYYWVGAITPLGGVSFILGWLALAWGLNKNS
jgi:uncharacterized membrane protein YgdD (TMEM256/DUF423 family)